MIKCPISLISIENACGTNMGGLSEVMIGEFGMATFEYEYQVIDTKTSTEYESLSEVEKAKYEEVGQEYIQYAKNIDGEKIKSAIKSATLEQGAEPMLAFQFKPQTASFTQTLEHNDNGVNFWNTAISLVFGKQDGAKRLSIMSLMQAETCAVVKDNNKKYWFVGLTQPLQMTEGTAESGTAFADNNSYNVTLSCADVEMALPISEEAVNTLVTGVAQSNYPNIHPDVQPDYQGGNENGSEPDLEG
jgi:hypothetical protein